MALSDGLYNLCLVASRTALDIYRNSRSRVGMIPASFDERRRTAAFLEYEIPLSIAMFGYAGLATLSAIIVPLIFRQLRFYDIVILYAAAPVMAFYNAYGCGLSDW